MTPDLSKSCPTATLWRLPAPLVLASGSPTRRAMLEALSIPLDIIKPDLNEAALAADWVAQAAKPAQIAAALALAKAQAVSASQPHRLVLAADQTLEWDGRLGMKAVDLAAAHAQLAALRGREHQLHSAAVLMCGGIPLWQGVDSATLTLRDFSEDFLDRYLALMGNRVLGTVGAYEIEGLGGHLFSRVEGAHATILGLPLAGVLEALRQHGALLA